MVYYLYQNRDKFSQSVQEVASVDLAKMGLVIVSFTIKDVRDKNGYLDSLGKPRIAQVKGDAEIAEAEALKETRIKKAEAEKESQQAELGRQTEIAEATKEKELKLAKYKEEQDIAKAKSDQAYNLESAVAQQKVTEQEMEVKIIEKQKQIELEEKEILRREKQYDSEVKKKADADRYAKEQEALAEKTKEYAEVDAENYRKIQMAEASKQEIDLQTEAEANRTNRLAEAEANKVKAEGQAKAESILAIGKSEAEAKEKLAEAFKLYGEQAMLSMLLEVMPALVREASLPVSAIKDVTIIGGGDDTGIEGFASTGLKQLANIQAGLKSTVGLDYAELVNSAVGNSNIGAKITDLTKTLDNDNEFVTVEDMSTEEN